MGRFSREEIEAAFRRYQVQGRDAARSGDWARWGEMFTEDCTYVEQQVGEWGGREAAVREMAALMHQTEGTPWVWVNQYPVKSYIVDEDRGWVWSQIWNRMEDPGDGIVYQENCLTMLRYDGNGLFNYEEDLYNPHAYVRMVERWVKANEACKEKANETLRQARAEAASAFSEVDAGEPLPPPPFAEKYAAERAGRLPRGRFPREEIAEAFDHYRRQLALAGKTTDWRHWGAALTKDATWIDCALGTLGKREALVREVEKRLHKVDDDEPWVHLCRFPVAEFVIDEASESVWAFFWARFRDPGDGSRHEAKVFAELQYGGDGLFKVIETLYNPNHFARILESWKAAKAAYDERRERRAKRLAAREARARAITPDG
ncbi:MAG: nuclear transport factor 2 family protein [Myxococcota bacterium]|nr:nuclear transport factor 2 family protein [Myxococcota bacterium]